MFVSDHISLHAALGSLTNLVELHLTYQLKSIGVDYRRDQFQFTNNDAKSLARGLEKCVQLRILRLMTICLNIYVIIIPLRFSSSLIFYLLQLFQNY